MHERAPDYPPFPDYASHQAIAAQLLGRRSFSQALDLQEWIRDLLGAGFAPDCEPGAEAPDGSRLLELTDVAGRVRVRAQYGGHWTARTALSAPAAEDEEASRWWASCHGLIPSAAIIAAAAAHAGGRAGDLLEAAGWERASRYLASDGVTVALETWSTRGGERCAARREDGVDRGWLLTYEDLRRVREIAASLETPAGVIAALVAADT
jgi:hypothetical protein